MEVSFGKRPLRPALSRAGSDNIGSLLRKNSAKVSRSDVGCKSPPFNDVSISAIKSSISVSGSPNSSRKMSSLDSGDGGSVNGSLAADGEFRNGSCSGDLGGVGGNLVSAEHCLAFNRAHAFDCDKTGTANGSCTNCTLAIPVLNMFAILQI